MQRFDVLEFVRHFNEGANLSLSSVRAVDAFEQLGRARVDEASRLLAFHLDMAERLEGVGTAASDLHRQQAVAAKRSIAEAFHFFAAADAVIKRQNDTLIIGKENIRMYYENGVHNATVHWTPDFIDVADCGTLGYTYGKFVWKIKQEEGNSTEIKGVFHTVWKKQQDNTWKYVWD